MRPDKVRKVQELRRSNASGPVQSKKAYKRSTFQREMTSLRNEQFHIGEASKGTPAAGNRQ